MTEGNNCVTFIYNGTQYDVSTYIDKHPGGKTFINNMYAQRKDFTQYFKALHSQQAQKILKSFPIISKTGTSSQSQQYTQIYKKVNHLFKPTWFIQIIMMISVGCIFLIGCYIPIGIISIICFGFSQIVIGWMGHSMSHSRDFMLQKVGELFGSAFGGFCLQWWAPKHNMHHMFTNSQLYDDDIKHEYKIYLYPFLYFKWRFDSLMTAISSKNRTVLLLILVNYLLLLSSRRNIVYFIVGELIAGFFSANVLIGNHERQKRFYGKIEIPFIDHQIITCRNYKQNNFIWLILMGGMQFQTEHHLFPQIPFYHLPKAAGIIKNQLEKINKFMIYGPVL